MSRPTSGPRQAFRRLMPASYQDRSGPSIHSGRCRWQDSAEKTPPGGCPAGYQASGLRISGSGGRGKAAWVRAVGNGPGRGVVVVVRLVLETARIQDVDSDMVASESLDRPLRGIGPIPRGRVPVRSVVVHENANPVVGTGERVLLDGRVQVDEGRRNIPVVGVRDRRFHLHGLAFSEEREQT